MKTKKKNNKERVPVMISPNTRKELKKYCRENGLLIECFVNTAVLERLQKLKGAER